MGYSYPGRSDYNPYSRPYFDSPDMAGRGILLPRGRSPFIPADLHVHDEKVGTLAALQLCLFVQTESQVRNPLSCDHFSHHGNKCFGTVA